MKLASLLAATSLAFVGCGGTTADDTGDATLTVHNQSDFDITELYLTHSTSSGWGPELLHGDPLMPDETITLAIDCGTFDAKFVDETGVSCEADDLDLCLNDSDWVITNNTCDFATARKLKQTLLQHAPRTAKQ